MTKIKGVKVFRIQQFNDKRGYFAEIYKKKNIKKNLIFSCLSYSKKNVLRGLHIQKKNPQGKLLTIIKGKIFDVIVDLRKKSKTFGKYTSIYLDSKKKTSIFIPKGCAHGYCALDKENIIFYSLTKYRNKKDERVIDWKDKDLNIKWPIKYPILSPKDEKGISFINFVSNK